MASSNYELWQPVCRQLNSTVQCSFDVTSPDYRGLNQGGVQLLEGFLNTLEVCEGNIIDWRIQRFVTPFYGYDPTEEDWQLLFGLAWRVNVSIGGAARYRPCGKLGPYPGEGLDPTWIDGQDLIARENEECVIIAFEGPTRDFSFLAQPHEIGSLEFIRHDFPHTSTLQTRLHLGVIDVSESSAMVRELLHQARIRFITTHSADATKRSAWQRAAEWVPIGQ